jgi:hypothetical protein
MKRKQFSSAIILTTLAFFLITACTGGHKMTAPMKTYAKIDIPDGEFLHYGFYISGDKIFDTYQVARKVTNDSGGLCYRLYLNTVSINGKRKYNPDYRNWPISILIDPEKGQTIESTGRFDTNELQDPAFKIYGYGGLFYFDYKLFPREGYVRYISKSLSGGQVLTKNFRVKIRSDYPVFDAFSTGSILFRVMDTGSSGVVYEVIPDMLKEPLPVSYSFGKKEKINVKAGSFMVCSVITEMADPFIGKLMSPFLKSSRAYVEDSDRKLVVKVDVMDQENMLEGISNVSIR